LDHCLNVTVLCKNPLLEEEPNLIGRTAWGVQIYLSSHSKAMFFARMIFAGAPTDVAPAIA
jgi:hypothetical protein